MNSDFDLVILGSGSTAFAAALRAQELGETAVMTEERTIGGTCVNRGCLPSKNLIEAAKLGHDVVNPRYPGLTPAELRLDFRKLIAQKDELIQEIHEAAMAMRFRAKVRDFVDLLHVYPTMAEALRIVAISRYKDPEKLSCCAE